MKVYESMFLLDSAKANKDWDGVAAHVHQIIDRHGASIQKSQKWGERKLAYEIQGHRRGTYMLVHFEADGDAIAAIRRDAGLSDTILRTLIVIDSDGDELPDILGDMAPRAREREVERTREREDKTPTDQDKPKAKPDEPKPDEPKPDEPTPDEPTPDEPTPDEPTPDEPTPDEPTPDETTPEPQPEAEKQPQPEDAPAEETPQTDADAAEPEDEQKGES